MSFYLLNMADSNTLLIIFYYVWCKRILSSTPLFFFNEDRVYCSSTATTFILAVVIWYSNAVWRKYYEMITLHWFFLAFCPMYNLDYVIYKWWNNVPRPVIKLLYRNSNYIIKMIGVCLQVIKCDQRSFDMWVLTEEGKQVVEHGSHEAVVFAAIDPKLGTLQTDVMVYWPYSSHVVWSLGLFFYRKLAQMQRLVLAKQCQMDG